jgi:two-component system cell cycle sensor histidine kinase/response regulator CckA
MLCGMGRARYPSLERSRNCTHMSCHVPAIKRLKLIVVCIGLILVGSWASQAESAIRVGVYNFAPLVSVRDDGKPEGLFIDVLEYVARREGWPIEYVAGSWDQCLKRVQGGEIDLLVCIGYWEDRASRLDFTKEFLFLDWGVVYRKTGSHIESIFDLAGKRIGCLKSSSYTKGLKTLLEQFDIKAELVEKDEYTQVFKAVEDGKVDAAINARISGGRLAKDYHIRPTEIFFAPVRMGFAAPKGKGSSVIDTLDRYISQLKSDRSSFYYDRLDHWTGFYKRKRFVSPWPIRALVITGVLCVLAVSFVYILRRQVRIGTSELLSVNQALSESEERYRAVFDNAAIGIDLVDNEGHFTDVNSAFCSMLGYSRDELLRLSVLDITHPEDLDAARARMDALLKGESSSCRLETRYVRKDGAILWGDLSVTGVRDENGVHRCTIGVISDITERKRAEEAVRETAMQLQLTIQAANVGLWDWDLRTSTVTYSPEWKRQLGYADNEISNTLSEWRSRLHPDDLNRVLTRGQEYLEDPRRDYEDEFRLRHKDGSYRWILARGSILNDEEGHRWRMLGLHLDITDRKSAEESVRRNGARLQLLYSISQYRAESVEDLLDFALNAAIKLTESRVGYIHHYDEEAQIFALSTWSEAVMKECAVAEQHTVRGLHETGIWGEAVRQRQAIVVNDFQAPNPLKKGLPEGHVELHKYLTVPVFSGDKIVSVVGVAEKQTDYDEDDVRQLSLLMDSVWRIVEVKRSEEVQKRLVTAIEQAAEGVMITDTTGAIQYVNPALERVSGFTGTELIGKKPSIFSSGEHHEGFYRRLWDTISHGETWTGRIINRAKDGRLYQEEATISPVRDSAGKITNFVAVKRDITEHLELSRQLFQAQKMEAVGTLAGGVAHDFNNLLQVVLGYSELILAEQDIPDRFRRDLKKIHHAATSGADLVQRLLTFSRKTEIKPLPLDLNRRIRQIHELLTRTITKMIQIELALGESLPAINADPTQVEQVIMNLAVNARDAMPDGGKLVIETAYARLDDEYAKVHAGAEPGPYVLLRVSDNGKGMPKEILEHIFEPFYTSKGPGEGTGLGLAMVYGIVKQHKGYIMCYSELGQGTTFKIYFPALASESCQEAEPAKRMPKGRGETILVVDDEELLRDLATRILVRAGYRVLTARNGNEALEIYRSQREEISLVILDVIMPHMGGKQCLDGLLRLNPQIKALMASGHVSTRAATDEHVVGAQGFLGKPYDAEQVLQTVRNILDLKRDSSTKS